MQETQESQVGKIPLEKEMLEYSCWENPMDRGAWRAAVHGVAEESDMAEYSCIPSVHVRASSHLPFLTLVVHHSSHRCILMP